MSNGYNDYKMEMEEGVHFFERDGKIYNGVKFTDDSSVLDVMSYQYCDLLCADTIVFTQVRLGGGLVAMEMEEGIVSKEEIEERSKVAIIQVGDEFSDPDGNRVEEYEETIYVFHNDWLMCDEHQKLFVVDEHHIHLYKEITEKDFVEKERAKYKKQQLERIEQKNKEGKL